MQQLVSTLIECGLADYEGASWDAVVKTNQDRGSIEYPFVESFSSALFCVMDG